MDSAVIVRLLRTHATLPRRLGLQSVDGRAKEEGVINGSASGDSGGLFISHATSFFASCARYDSIYVSQALPPANEHWQRRFLPLLILTSPLTPGFIH